MQRYRIGEVSKLVDVPVETIRFLEQKGLVKPEKNEENGYRYYSIWDVNRILEYKKFRQIGFSSKETVELVRNCALPSLLKQLDEKKKEAALLAHYYQAKALKLKNFQSVLGKVHELTGEYYIMNRPENYSLFTRVRSVQELRMTTAKETEGGFQELTRHYPFVEHIYRIKKEELSLPEGQEQAEWGFTVKKYWADRLGVQLLPKMEHLRAVTALLTVIRLGEQEYFTRSALRHVLDYMEKNHYQLNGDILGIYVATLREEDRNVRYMELWVPIKVSDPAGQLPVNEKTAALKQIFV